MFTSSVDVTEYTKLPVLKFGRICRENRRSEHILLYSLLPAMPTQELINY